MKPRQTLVATISFEHLSTQELIAWIVVPYLFSQRQTTLPSAVFSHSPRPNCSHRRWRKGMPVCSVYSSRPLWKRSEALYFS